VSLDPVKKSVASEVVSRNGYASCSNRWSCQSYETWRTHGDCFLAERVTGNSHGYYANRSLWKRPSSYRYASGTLTNSS